MAEEKKPTREELLARATGKRLKVPPPANMPGVQGNPPLPAGRVVGMRAPSTLTEQEREDLSSIGWTEDMPIPKNMASLFEQVKNQKLQEMVHLPLPVDPRQPPMEPPKIVPLNKLSSAQQMDLKKVLTQMAEDEAEAARREAESTVTLPPGVAESLRVTRSMGSTEENIYLDETEEQPAAQPEKAVRPEPVAAHSHGETGVGGQMLTHCPHCDGNLSLPSIPEPSYIKKMAFLHSVLGEKLFTDETDLFDGEVVVVFRQLTTTEIDTIYQQAYRDIECGRATREDFWARVNRYRLCLQLLSYKSTKGPPGFVHNLPDGLDEAANPQAKKCWPDPAEPLPPGDTKLVEVERRVTKEVLKTEAIFRIVNGACNQFNRLGAKLEAMVDNSDFWKRTVPPS